MSSSDILYFQPHDWLCQNRKASDSLNQVWLAGPGGNSKDIRGRPFVGRMANDDPRDREQDQVVLRHEFYCNQTCLLRHDDEDMVSDEDDDEELNNNDAGSDAEGKGASSKAGKDNNKELNDDDDGSDTEGKGDSSKAGKFIYSKAKCKVKLVVSCPGTLRYSTFVANSSYCLASRSRSIRISQTLL